MASPTPPAMRRPSVLSNTSSAGSGASRPSTLGTPTGATERRPSWAPSGTTTTMTRNPVSLRLNKVLATNFESKETREALGTVSALYASGSSGKSTAKEKEMKEVKDGKEQVGDEDGSLALGAQSIPTGQQSSSRNEQQALAEAIPGESAARARKNLRRDMEQQLAEGSRKFLEALGEVDAKLKALQTHVSAMRASCDTAETQLALTNESSRTLLERAGSLRDERQEVDTKKSIISLFLTRFTLSDAEAEALASRDVAVDEGFVSPPHGINQHQYPHHPSSSININTNANEKGRFFAAMDRAEKIREDCRVLMAGEEGATRAGLEIMSATATHLEHGYEKMLRYCGDAFRALGRTGATTGGGGGGDNEQLEVSPQLRECVRRLRKRPELLNEALLILSTTRQTALQASFLTALTRGGPSGYPRPIELHAHDPLRYVGDMLAWVHQAIAAEREFLESLFAWRGGRGDGRMVGSVRVFARRRRRTGAADADADAGGDGKLEGAGRETEKDLAKLAGVSREAAEEEEEEEEWMAELMDLAVTKLCVPLRLRVQQTVRSQESSIVAYKIANLLQFYLMTMRRTIGEDALLSTTLKEITDMAYKVFYDSIETQSQALARVKLAPDDPSLTAPPAILEHAQILREVMGVYQSSLLGDEDAAEISDGFQQVLDIMLDPAVHMCIAQAEEKHAAAHGRWDGAVFVLNCLCYLQTVLGTFEFTTKKRTEIQKLIDQRVLALTDEHSANILKDAGLSEVVQICKTHKPDEPLSRIPATEPAALQRSLRHFSRWLSGADVVASPRLAPLTMPLMHAAVHQQALARLARAYQLLCDEVRNPKNRYEAASTLLGSERPFGQVHLLWQIFGLEEEEEEESEEEEEESEEDDDDDDEEEEESSEEEGGKGASSPAAK